MAAIAEHLNPQRKKAKKKKRQEMKKSEGDYHLLGNTRGEHAFTVLVDCVVKGRLSLTTVHMALTQPLLLE